MLPPLEQVAITSVHIKSVAKRLGGSAGHSGTDLTQWSSFLLRYGIASARLREAVAASTRRHANEVVPWADIRALLAHREALPWTNSLEYDLSVWVNADSGLRRRQWRWHRRLMCCGADQLCAGTKAGIKAAVHAMRDLFETDETEVLLLVDASNVFNVLS